MVKLGSKVRDKISGFEGIVAGITVFLNGCVSVGIAPMRVDKDGRIQNYEWLDEQRLDVIEDNAFSPSDSKATAGGPQPSYPPDGGAR